MERTTIDTGFTYFPKIVVNGNSYSPAMGVETRAFTGTKVKVKVIPNTDRRKKPVVCIVSYAQCFEVWHRVGV